jgi:ubiquinone/menaquinone biosynthesis C-methylase UbiE
MSESSEATRHVNDASLLIEMAMGYARSRTLCAAARLGIADVLGDGESTVDQLAVACRADPTSLYRLLRALASFGIVSESKPATFVLTPLGAPLRKDQPDSAWAAIIFWADLLADSWSYLTECVQTGNTAAEVMRREGVTSRWSMDPDSHAIFRAVMGTGPAQNYLPLARAWDFSPQRVVADLGGGGGALLLAILETYPSIQGMLVDFPESINRAAPRFAAADLAQRSALVAADLREAVPPGADVYVIKHVLHGCSDDAAVGILQNCRSVIPREGRLLVIEFVLPDVFNRVDKELEQRVMSDLNMLAVTGGKERSAVEWKELLQQAGFEVLRIIAVPGESASIIEAAPVA